MKYVKDINLISAGLKEMFVEPVFVKCISGGSLSLAKRFVEYKCQKADQ